MIDAASVDVDRVSEGLKALSNPKRLALLRFLREPHHLEEIASELRMSRQAAQDHVQFLLNAGLVEKRAGERARQPVVEYRLVRPRFFALFEDLRALGALLPEADDEALLRTMAGPASAAGARGDVPEVVVVGGFRPGLKASVHRGEGAPGLLIGRDPTASLVLDWDLMVSNRHAEIRPTAQGHELVDLFSRNGTHLNGATVAGGARVPLRSGDLVQVGRTMLVFRS